MHICAYVCVFVHVCVCVCVCVHVCCMQAKLRSLGVEVVEFDFLTPEAVADYCYSRGFLQVRAVTHWHTHTHTQPI